MVWKVKFAWHSRFGDIKNDWFCKHILNLLNKGATITYSDVQEAVGIDDEIRYENIIYSHKGNEIAVYVEGRDIDGYYYTIFALFVNSGD